MPSAFSFLIQIPLRAYNDYKKIPGKQQIKTVERNRSGLRLTTPPSPSPSPFFIKCTL